MIVGLTGGIASGKSTVSKMLSDEGIPIIDADKVAREVVEPGQQAYEDIVDHFGLNILKSDGAINREALGSIIFENEQKREMLNEIVHPAVRQNMKKQAVDLKQRGHKLIVMDIPLLIESKLFNMVDEVLLVYVPEHIQLERLRERNGYSEEEALQRINSQLPIEEKKQYASFIIDNSGSIDRTKQQVKQILNEWIR